MGHVNEKWMSAQAEENNYFIVSSFLWHIFHQYVVVDDGVYNVLLN